MEGPETTTDHEAIDIKEVCLLSHLSIQSNLLLAC